MCTYNNLNVLFNNGMDYIIANIPSDSTYDVTEMPFIDRLEAHALGNLLTGSGPVKDSYGLDDWFNKVENNYNNRCFSCELLPVCGGHCPKHWIDKKYEVCPSFKYNIKEKIQLQSLVTRQQNAAVEQTG